MSEREDRILVALGGNAMAGPGGEAHPSAQRAAVELAMEKVADLVAAGRRVVLTHGNGPQVGNLVVKNDVARDVGLPFRSTAAWPRRRRPGS